MIRLVSLVLLLMALSACQEQANDAQSTNDAGDASTAAAASTQSDNQADNQMGADPDPSAGLPPLIDREVFFGNPQVAFASLSPTGEFFSFSKEIDGVLNLWVSPVDGDVEAAKPITNDRDRPVTNSFWSQDGQYILFTQDAGGDENFRVYAVDPRAEPEPGQKVPPARDLTPYDNIRAQIVSLPKSDPDTILVGINDRNPQLHDVYRVSIKSGERTLLRENNDNIAGWMADLQGNLRLGFRIAASGDNELLDVSGESPRVIMTCANEETCNPLQFHSDGKRIYFATNRGDRDLVELVLLDPMSGEEELIERDPEGKVDFGNAIFSRVNDELIATSYTGARVRWYAHDDDFAADLKVLGGRLSRGDLFFRQQSSDDQVWIVKESLDIDSGPNYLYRRDSGEIRLLYRPNPEIPVEHMAEMKAVEYQARDGLTIPAYLTLPRGVEAKNLPVVMLPHGGPWARDNWGWAALPQFLANRGYAVMQPNFRGSTGYGKAFLFAGNRQWGTGSMQHDISDGVQWLIDQGIADPERVAIMGGSYGGYATLAGVAFTPELYAAGISIVGPSSILTLLETIPPYWEPIKKMFTIRVGDPEDAEQLEMLKAQSPLYHAEQIEAPLMIIQGANDPRVKKSESDQIVVAMRDLDREVTYLVAADEGHGFANEINNLASYAAVERFFADHLNGRYQESMRPAIRDRLAELTQDVGLVNLPGPSAEADAQEQGEQAAPGSDP